LRVFRPRFSTHTTIVTFKSPVLALTLPVGLASPPSKWELHKVGLFPSFRPSFFFAPCLYASWRFQKESRYRRIHFSARSPLISHPSRTSIRRVSILFFPFSSFHTPLRESSVPGHFVRLTLLFWAALYFVRFFSRPISFLSFYHYLPSQLRILPPPSESSAFLFDGTELELHLDPLMSFPSSFSLLTSQGPE